MIFFVMAEGTTEDSSSTSYPHRFHANQFIFYLKSGRGVIVWGDTVTHSEEHYQVNSADGQVIQMFKTNDVDRWQRLRLT